MPDYNPKFPHELTDAQLQREKYESDASKALARGGHSHKTLDDSPPLATGETEKESYNTIPGE